MAVVDGATYVIDPDGEVVFLLEFAGSSSTIRDEERDDGQDDTSSSDEDLTEGPSEGPSGPREPSQKRARLEDTKKRIRIRVSAKHLTLASPIWKRTLSGNWKEGTTLGQNGSVELPIEDWCPTAFLLLMRIIHCQHHDLPNKIDLHLLSKLAVLVDYYECKKPVQFFANRWIHELKPNFPRRYSQELMLWLFVSLVFDKRDLLVESTSIAVTQSKAPIPSAGLPIPPRVLNALNDRREKGIKLIFDRLRLQREEYLQSGSACSFECAATLLGMLDKQIYKHLDYFKEIPAPYVGLNYLKLAAILDGIEVQKFAILSPSEYGRIHKCGNGYDLLKVPANLAGFESFS